jgi:hypothetical protein
MRLAVPSGRRHNRMKYGIAWLLGVPVSVLLVIYLITHIVF